MTGDGPAGKVGLVRSVVLKLEFASESLVGLGRTLITRAVPTISDSTYLGDA